MAATGKPPRLQIKFILENTTQSAYAFENLLVVLVQAQRLRQWGSNSQTCSSDKVVLPRRTSRDAATHGYQHQLQCGSFGHHRGTSKRFVV